MKLIHSMVSAFSWSRVASALSEEQEVLHDGLLGEEVRPMSVAIIGAGAAGASSAFHLAKFAGAAGLPVNITITIYDRNSSVGGRSTTVNAYDHEDYPIELGASIFVLVNQILVNATKDFNLSTSSFGAKADGLGPALGVWDGEGFVITMKSENVTWWDTAKLLWRYGLSPLRTMNLMKSTVGKFLRMYDEPVFPFMSLTQAVQDVGLLAVTAATGEEHLRGNGIGLPFARDVIQASTRVNYAQNLNYIHGLETMVCMATNGAMSVEGGNWQIFDSMIDAANATRMLGMEVTGVERHENGTYFVKSVSADEDSAAASQIAAYDAVVLAAPYQFANITLPANSRVPDKIPYVRLHVTLVASTVLLNPAFFEQPVDKLMPLTILTTLQPGERPCTGPEAAGSPGFFSISMVAAPTNPRTGAQEFVYKIFSPTAVNNTTVNRLFSMGLLPNPPREGRTPELSEHVSWIYRKVWHSYPYEYPRVTFEDIRLGENMWYTSGIESFVSTMETSALMGMNVARLIVDQWLEQTMNGMDSGGMRQPSVLPDS